MKVLVPLAAILTALLVPASGQAWTLNEVQLDTNYCGTNLQLGSDKTASKSNTPSFLVSGDGGLSAYDMYIDGTYVGRFNSDGYGNVCVFTTIPLSEGQHVITGNELTPHPTYTTIPFTFSVDTIAPPATSVPTMSPVSDTGVKGDNITNVRTFTVTGTSSTNSGISLVRIMRGGQFIIGGATPSSGTWASAATVPTDGPFVIQGMAVDEAANNSPLSTPITVTVDTVKPTSTVTNPTDGSIVSGTIPFSASASDASGIMNVAFQVDGVTKATVSSAPYTYMWNTGTATAGAHTLTAVATDVAGNTTSTSANVTVANSGATTPGSPQAFATAGNNSVSLTWTTPADGGSAITGYKVYRGTASGGETLLTTLGNVSNWTDSTALNGTTYYYQVTALNSVGESARSSEVSAFPSGLPGAPTLQSAVAGNGSVTLSWTAAAGNGSPVTSYTATSSPGGFTCTTGSLGCTVSGLSNGTTYTFTVKATNANGAGPASNGLSATPTAPASTPGAPTLSGATAGNGSVSLAWTAAAPNGSPVTSYTATSSPGGFTCTTAGLGCTVSGLTNGTSYSFTVVATNANGNGPASNALAATPAGPPGAPTLNSAAAGSNSVSLSWSSAAANGSPVTSYTATSSPGGFTCTTSGLGCTVSGLTNGTTYSFTVKATNGVGTGPASNALSATPVASVTVPGAPTLNSATRSSSGGAVDLGWSAPASNGGAPITSYTATSSPGGFTCTTAGLACTVSGLTNGTTYSFTVTATNSAGTGAASNAMSATPAALPGAPTLTLATGGNGTATLTWSAAPANGSPVTSYTATSSPGGLTCSTSTLSCTASGLTNGVSYSFTVTATNGVGTGPPSNALFTIPAGVPGAPTLTAASRGNGSVTLGWSAAAGNGSSVTSYTATSSPGGFTCTSGSLGCTVSGLTNGTTYTFTVTATNAVGTGPASNAMSATPAAVPSAPVLTSATAGNGLVQLAWSAANGNGSPVTSYTATSSPGGLACTTAGTSCTVGGLANGTTYTFTVAATSAVGTGAASNAMSATPAGAPGAPSLTSAAAGNGSVTLGWSAASSNGSPVTSYTATSSPGGFTCTTGSLGCTVSGLTNGTTYTFTVTATNGVGTGPASNALSATPTGTTGSPPGIATLTFASAGNGRVTLGWLTPPDNGSAITGYNIYRSTLSGRETLVASTGATTGYADTTVANGTTYYYQVTAVNGAGESGLSNERAATPFGNPSAPNLSSATTAGTSVTLSWNPVSDGGSPITGYKVYRGTASGGETLLTTLGNVTGWTDSGLANGTYYYKVTAVNTYGESTLSNERSATVGSTATVPGAPNLTSASAGNGNVSLSWSAPSDGGSAITGYRVYRGTTSGGETLLTTLGNVTSWNDAGVSNGTTYYYTVSAVNAVGESSRSNERSATPSAPLTRPSPPSLVSVVPGSGTITVDWNAPTSDGGAAVTNYNVYRGTFSGGETLLTTIGSQTAYVDTSAVPGVTYYYQVTALNSVGESARSNELSAGLSADTTPPGVPTSLKLAIAGTTQLAIYWTASTGDVASYDVYRDGVFVGNTTNPNYLDSGLAAGSSHTYTVRARDAAGNASAASSALSARAASVSGSSATVAGVVYSGGKPITNVVVQLTGSGVNTSTKTGKNGVYKFSNQRANLAYTVTVNGRSTTVTGLAGQVVLVAFNL